MKVLICIAIYLTLCTAEPVPDALSNDDIRDEIEVAARDSADLADELAAMLARLENEEEEDEESISVVATELERALEATEELSKASQNRKTKSRSKAKTQKQLSRRPKQDSSFLESLADVLDLDFDEDFDESGKRNKEEVGEDDESETENKATAQQEQRKGKSFEASSSAAGKNGNGGYSARQEEKKEEETCETAMPANKVKVCVPDFDTKAQRLHFYSQETYDQEFCYYKTLTKCDIKDEAEQERKVCSFVYNQANHKAPATNVQVSFERHSEKMGVTNCKHVKSDYGQVEEICEIQYVSQHYRLPIVEEEVLELVPVTYPEPDEKCENFSFKIPTVECKEEQDDYCVMCAHIRDKKVEVTADQVYPARYGQCQDTTLKLDQQRCTIERKVKVPAPKHGYGAPRPGYGAPRQTYGGGFTAFQG